MATACIPYVTFEFHDQLKPVVARFDQAQASTDGGAVLLKALDDQLQLTNQLAGCLVDRRDPDKIRHTVRDLLRPRIFGLACGYEDANDAARLADDPLHKLTVGRDPMTGAALASQPTLSRFENAVSPRALYRLGRTVAMTVIAHHQQRLKGRAQRITMDLDPPDDPTHGQQAFPFFNGHYDTWCSLPLVATLTCNDETDQYLVAIVLRPGNSPAKHGACGLLRTLLQHLRRASREPRSESAWMAGSPATTGWTSWRDSGWSRWSDWPATPGWCGAPGGSWGKPMAGPNTVATPNTSSARPWTPPAGGHIGGA